MNPAPPVTSTFAIRGVIVVGVAYGDGLMASPLADVGAEIDPWAAAAGRAALERSEW